MGMKIFTSIIFIFMTIATFAQEKPEELIERHFRSIGGKERIEKLVSAKRIGTIEFPDHGQPEPKGLGNYQTHIAYPDRVRIQISVGSYKLDQIRNRKQYWDFDGKNFRPVTESEKNAELNDTSLKANRELLWWQGEHQNIHKIDPPKIVSNSNCIGGTKNASEEFVCFDSVTGILKAYGNEVEYRFYDDWREVSGIKMPFRIKQYKKGLLSYSVVLNTVDVNINLPDSTFVP